MDPVVARDAARQLHGGQRNRFGEAVIDHVARVQAAVPAEARTVAWLHDVLEGPGVTCQELQARGLSAVEIEALELLTHAPTESYRSYVERIARAGGPAGALARAVKLADLDDHLAHGTIPAGAPPYAWARRRIADAVSSGWGDASPPAVDESDRHVSEQKPRST
ncbi:MAG TPA: hypothetical protein VGM33_08830 [Baekduia sp.]|jgi:hypothetical protein